MEFSLNYCMKPENTNKIITNEKKLNTKVSFPFYFYFLASHGRLNLQALLTVVAKTN